MNDSQSTVRLARNSEVLEKSVVMTTNRNACKCLADALQQFAVAAREAPSRGTEDVETYGESIEAVSRVAVADSGETLVDLRTLEPALAFAQAHPWGAAYRRQFFVRQTVVQMVGWAQSLLPRGYRLLIIEGYRPPILQRRLFQSLYAYLQCLYPDWDDRQIREAANVLIADPDIDAPAPHSTGGAVDLTLVDTNSRPLDMTSPLGWNEAAAPTCCDRISKEARANRQLLIDALSVAGLSNYPGEWWHWSYGEPGWAVRTGRSAALYGPVSGPYAAPAAAPACGPSTQR